MASPAEADAFFDERWPEARAVSDEGKELYRAFGLTQGSLGQLLGPRVFAAGLRAALRGHGVGRPVGDPRMLSGWFLVRDRNVVWSHPHEHAGAPRRWGELAQARATS